MPPFLKDRRVQAGIVVAVAVAGWLLLRPAVVDVVTVTPQAIRETLQLTGRVATRDRATLAAQVSGTVLRVPVEEGDKVKAGQVLLLIDNPEIGAATRQADATLAQAEARLAKLRDIDRPTAQADAERAQIESEQAERQVKNLEPLVASQTVSAEQYRAAKETLALRQSAARSAQLRAQSLDGGRDWKLAEADRAQAGATRAVALARQSYTTVRAPADGLIVGREVDPGAPVQVGTPLLSFAPTGATEIVIDVDERFLDLLKLQQAVKVVADAFPGQAFDGTVGRIAPRVDAARGSVEVHVSIPAPPAWLREDMTASVEILVGEKQDVPVLPVSALIDLNSKPWAWCVTDGRLVRCDLKLGLRDDMRAEILAGAAPGTVVVANANKALVTGKRVRTRALPANPAPR